MSVLSKDQIEALGLKVEDIESRVVEQCVERLMTSIQFDYDNDTEFRTKSPFARHFDDLIRKRIDERVQAIADEHVLPRVDEYVANVTIRDTNRFGEDKSEPLTFVEYMARRAENYLIEPVNFEGKSRAESSYNWNKSTTRVAFMIDRHLQFHIERVSKEALNTANAAIAEGIQGAVRTSLEGILAGLKVSVKV